MSRGARRSRSTWPPVRVREAQNFALQGEIDILLENSSLQGECDLDSGLQNLTVLVQKALRVATSELSYLVATKGCCTTYLQYFICTAGFIRGTPIT